MKLYMKYSQEKPYYNKHLVNIKNKRHLLTTALQILDVDQNSAPYSVLQMIGLLAVMTQRDALLIIKNSTGLQANWNLTDPICQWEGVTCNRDSLVIGIDFTGFNMTGQLPDVFGSFPFLKSLYLNDNAMSSTFPLSICQLTHLQYLQANDAGLTGAIPQCICSLSFIQYVYMDNNTLAGPIPACIGQLEFLRELHLTSNFISGDIPTGFNNLSHLIELHLDCNEDLNCSSELATRPSVIFVCGLDDCTPKVPEVNVCPNFEEPEECDIFVPPPPPPPFVCPVHPEPESCDIYLPPVPPPAVTCPVLPDPVGCAAFPPLA